MSKTYSEIAQAGLIKAAREVRSAAIGVLDDTTREVLAISSLSSLVWTKQTAKKYAEMANALEIQAEGLTVMSPQLRSAMTRSRARYSAAVTRYQIDLSQVGLFSEAQVDAEIKMLNRPYNHEAKTRTMLVGNRDG